jgi:hypothetical protein
MGVSGKSHAPAPIGQEAGWVSELVWTQRLEEKFFASARNRTPVTQSVVRHYTDWATPAPSYKGDACENIKQKI